MLTLTGFQTLSGLFCPNSMNTYKKSGMLPSRLILPFIRMYPFPPTLSPGNHQSYKIAD
ncbi:hypothetical protein KsCSTR_29210 [Candidatus Kuenenia stuttgartiensis]|uniref:Uncharacterized protein n=1 Tax=Kuenenia stuttgartiensis TaxID=174633 RepID=Q1Q5U1_KUEST|nr:hypothetical protein KsCSTR_29210 [Candidatus Kuenenia stuttgartiensis]CAJ75377.1 unknown protein [Candidatus Kuenenia stuttgartiensis]